MVTFRRRRRWPGPAPPDQAPLDPEPPNPAPAKFSELPQSPTSEPRPTFRAVLKDAIQDTPRTIRFGFLLALFFAGFATVLQAAKGIHIHLGSLGLHLRGFNYVITITAVGGAVGGSALTSLAGVGLRKLINTLNGPGSNDEG